MYNTILSKALTRMGFRDRHVAEALQYCNDQPSALDWLCKSFSYAVHDIIFAPHDIL